MIITCSHLFVYCQADRLNNWIVLGVFLITVINVFVSAFGIEPLGDFDPDMLDKMIISKTRCLFPAP